MKPFKIALVAILINLILLLGVLLVANLQNPDHLSNINWLAFVPVALGYAVLVAVLGWLWGSLVNGLLVYPKKRTRNLTMSQLGMGLLFLAGLLYFSWSTGSFTRDDHGPRQMRGHVGLSDPNALYRDVADHGLHAF